MTYQECLRLTFFDLESWVIALAGLVISFFVLRYGTRIFASVFAGLSLLLAISWAYLYYELNCVELVVS